MKLIDLSGQTFGRLLVKHRAVNNKSAITKWACVCSCGTEKTVIGTSLTHGLTKSCGCLRRELVTANNVTHGQGRHLSGARTKEYSTWKNIKTRCYNPSSTYYSIYGGRGISMCDRWRESFEAFFADIGKAPSSDHSIDRIDVNGNYEPGNCRWTTAQIQAENKRNTKTLTMNGETKTVHEWARITGLTEKQINLRTNRGWSDADALTKPIKGA